jgi:ABC-type methionine transport system ATPase subunit
MLLVGNNMDVIKEVKSQLSSKFDMKDLGAANFIMGMEIKRDRANKKLWLNKRKYVEMILQRFNMHGSKQVKVPIPIGVNLSQISVPRHRKKKRTCPMFRMPVQLVILCM